MHILGPGHGVVEPVADQITLQLKTLVIPVHVLSIVVAP